MKTICHFCNKQTACVPLNETTFIEVYFCYGCQAEYTYWNACEEPTFVHLYTTINNNMYRWSTFFVNKKQRGAIFHVKEPGIPGVKPNKDLKRVKSFSSNLPTITPDNVNVKLKFMLLFL